MYLISHHLEYIGKLATSLEILVTAIFSLLFFRFEDLASNPKKTFANKVLTDGTSVVFIFSRPAKTEIDNIDLELDDFSSEEVQEFFHPCAIDPGRTNAVTAAYGYGSTSHMLRRLSTKEYYHQIGSQQSNASVQRMKDRVGVTTIESAVPTGKTANLLSYLSHVQYLVRHLTDLFNFYNEQQGQRSLLAYKNKQRAVAEAVNLLINGGKKYNRQKRKNTRKNRKKRKRKKEIVQNQLQ
jgi:hypothetical protein